MAKPIPQPPAPRLYLATPLTGDPSSLVASLPALLAKADIAAVLLRLAKADQKTQTKTIKALVPVVQSAGSALLLDEHLELVARAGADGAHVSGVDAIEDALSTLKPEWIAGVGGLETRHDSMSAGETGVDYVMFGEPNKKGERPSIDAITERLQWWAELFEPPCVGYAVNLDEARQFAAAGADFVLVGDFIWEDARGPAAALADANEALGQGYAVVIENFKAVQG